MLIWNLRIINNWFKRVII